MSKRLVEFKPIVLWIWHCPVCDLDIEEPDKIFRGDDLVCPNCRWEFVADNHNLEEN